MRRPVCAVALLMTVVLWIFLCTGPDYVDPYRSRDGEGITITGRVTGKEYKRGANAWTGEETLTLLITVDHVTMAQDDCSARDKVLIRVPVAGEDNAADPAAPIGAYIRASGTLSVFQTASNSGAFDALLYYRTLGYVFQIRNATVQETFGVGNPLDNVLYTIQSGLRRVLAQCVLDTEDADIMAAMLLGEKGWLSQEIRDLYQTAGIIHILAISGLHIQIIGMGCYRLLGRTRMPHTVCALVAASVMLLYGRMTGVTASSFRALVMFCLHILARMIHRTYDLLTALSIAAILILLEQPLYLYHAGFLFSFGAVLSIGLLTPILPADILPPEGKAALRRMEKRLQDFIPGLRQNPRPQSLPVISLQGLAVTIGTFPINLLCYGTFPLYSVLLNALVLPLMSLVMILGLLLLVCGLFSVPAGNLAGLPIHYLLYFYQELCRIAAELPGHVQVMGHPEAWTMAVFLLCSGTLIVRSQCRKARRLPWIITLMVILGSLWILTIHNKAGLRIHVIDVGQGDGVYIECDGAGILIDGGSTDQSDIARYQLEPVLTWYGADTIDLAIMTHEDADHMNGLLSILLSQKETGIRILRIGLPDVAENQKGENYLAVEQAARESNTEILYLHRGSVLSIGELTMTCLHPAAEAVNTEVNETSVTLYLTYGKFTALFTGDLEGSGETACMQYMESRPDLFPLAGDGDPSSADTVTLLKTAHHGSRGATSEAFLSMVHPSYAVISCGKNNGYGHPHPETIERLQRAGARILDTRYAGEITITTDGDAMQVQTFLQEET